MRCGVPSGDRDEQTTHVHRHPHPLARRLLDLGVKQIVVTLGAQGSLIVTPESVEEVPAPTVEALDVTGSGDSFNAALAIGVGEGAPLSEAVARANCAGAYCATRLGVIDGLPTAEALDEFIASIK